MKLIELPTGHNAPAVANAVIEIPMADEKGRDYKIIAAPDDDPRFAEIQTLDDLPPHMPREVEHFFSVYKQLENKRVQVHGWAGRDRAHAVIRRHMR